MSHHSRLSNFLLDCPVDDLAPHIEFWSRALGKPVVTDDQDGDGKYAELQTEVDEPFLRDPAATRVVWDASQSLGLNARP